MPGFTDEYSPKSVPQCGMSVSTRAPDFAGGDAVVLGLGVEPRTPAWGSLLSDARGYLNVAWWTATFPVIAIALVALAANFMGDSLRDRLDPALRNNA